MDSGDTKYVEPMHLVEAFEMIDDAMKVVDKLDPDGTQYRYPEAIAKDKATKTRTLKYQFPRGDINLTAYAAFAGWLVQAADITMTTVQEQLSWTATESRGHPGVLFHSLVIEHYSDPSKWFPLGLDPSISDSLPPEGDGM